MPNGLQFIKLLLMKKVHVVSLIAIFTLLNMATKGQIRIYPCNRFPTSSQLFKTLANKPVINIHSSSFRLRCNINDSIKSRLLYLLTPQVTEQELNDFAEREVKENYDSYKIEDKAKYIAKENDTLYKKTVDSIIKCFKEYHKREFLKNNYLAVDASILRTVAYLNLKEAIPIIKKYLHSYNLGVAELCLARLGSRELQNKIIKGNTVNNTLIHDDWLNDFESKFKILTFINTRESIYQLHAWIDTTHRFTVSSSGGEGWAAYRVIAYLKEVIMNPDFQLLTKNIDGLGFCPCSANDVLNVKAWMIANRNKYELNNEFYMY
jgi:hypothetical protein